MSDAIVFTANAIGDPKIAFFMSHKTSLKVVSGTPAGP
jgi:hypothetical protein